MSPRQHAESGQRPRKRQKRSTDHQISVSCQRCRSKKIRCDELEPKCGTCERAGVECVLFDAQSGSEITRRELRELEEKILLLEVLLERAGVEVPASSLPQSRRCLDNPHPPTPGNASIPRFLGEQSGVGFIKFIISTIRRHTQRTTSRRVYQSRSQNGTEIHTAHSLPSYDDASHLITTYVQGLGVQHPFIALRDIQQLLNYHYPRGDERNQTMEAKLNPLHLNMIFALASIDYQRRGIPRKHPFGYFMAALQHVAGQLNFGTIEDIQGLLLFAMFGQYYKIGCSIWELSQLCLRMCVELGLHKRSPLPLSQCHEQDRRRVFWECYRLDRTAASITGRPLGVDEDDIEIDEPYDCWDGELRAYPGDLEGDGHANDITCARATEMAAFNATLKLARIGSSIRTKFYSRTLSRERSHNDAFGDLLVADSQQPLNAGDTYHVLNTFDKELSAWKNSIPVIQESTSVFASREWLELLFAQERFHLIRAAIESIHTRQSLPPEGLLNLCYHAAAAFVHQFGEIRKGAPTVCTWQNLQQILSCGLCIIFCSLLENDARHQKLIKTRTSSNFRLLAEFGDMTTRAQLPKNDAESIVIECSDSLFWIAERMPDALQFAQFFDALRHQLHRAMVENRSIQSGESSITDNSHLRTGNGSVYQHSNNSLDIQGERGVMTAAETDNAEQLSFDQMTYPALSTGTAGSATTDDEFWSDSTWNLDSMISQFFDQNDSLQFPLLDSLSWPANIGAASIPDVELSNTDQEVNGTGHSPW